MIRLTLGGILAGRQQLCARAYSRTTYFVNDLLRQHGHGKSKQAMQPQCAWHGMNCQVTVGSRLGFQLQYSMGYARGACICTEL